MRFKVDENLHDAVAALLVSHGHDADTVHDEGLRGSDDSQLLTRCIAERRAFVTFDLDFTDIRTYQPAKFPGVIVLRLSSQSRGHVLSVMSRVVDQLNVPWKGDSGLSPTRISEFARVRSGRSQS